MDKKKDLSYKIGYTLAVIVALSATACIVALAAKFIIWLF
jgi:hypothetical protein